MGGKSDGFSATGVLEIYEKQPTATNAPKESNSK